MSIVEKFVRHVGYPLWDVKDRSDRLREYRRLLRSQWSSPQTLAQLQLHRLNEMLTHCWRSVPYYRQRWREAPRLSCLAELGALPLLSKNDVREFRHSLLSSDYPVGSLIETRTGGSTGTSLVLSFDRRCQEFRNAAAMRSDGWAGWQPGMLVAALWGTPPVPRTLKERLRNSLHDRLMFLDTMDLTESNMSAFVRRMTLRGARALFGHSHSLYVFGKFILDSRISAPRLRAVISTSMMLLEQERAIIEQAFGCPVTDRYGCEEVGLIASECERHQGLHVNMEHLVVEIVRADGTPAKAGEEGIIVVTDLINRGMPFIRYRVEDIAIATMRSCACGRAATLLERLVGRVADFLVRRDGSRVAGVSLVEKTLTAIEGIEQLQIVQTDYARFELNAVTRREARPEIEAKVGRVLREVFGEDAELVFNHLPALPQERNSKYRFAICRVPHAA